MAWVDTHCHLQLDDRDPSELVGRAGEVAWLMVPGVDAASSAAARTVASGLPIPALWSAGLHPHDASRWQAEQAEIVALAAEAAAVGEAGLDYYRNLAPRDHQRHAFVDQVELAAELDKPIIVHCRDAFADVYEILGAASLGARAVLHCWTGGPRWTRRFLELGVTFSFAGPVAFETGETVRLGAALVPMDRALVETDTPYLAPPPHRAELNEPGWVGLVGAALARVWGEDVDLVAATTSANAARVFGMPT